MLEGWSIDWSTTLVLAAIVVLEGVRRVPEGAYLLRHTPASGWSVVAGPAEQRHWRLASFGAPVAMHIMLSPGVEPTADSPADIERLVKRMRWRLAALRFMGAAVLIGVVLGVPMVTGRFGARGLFASLGGVFGLSTVTTLIAAMTVSHVIGDSARSAFRVVGGVLSPFAAPRAAEIVLERAVSDTPSLVVVRALVDERRFAEWIRPRAYDFVKEGPGGAAELRGALTPEECQVIVATPPTGRADSEPYCPRCGGTFRPDFASCSSCAGVALRR